MLQNKTYLLQYWVSFLQDGDLLIFHILIPVLAIFSKKTISWLISFRKWFNSFSSCNLRFYFSHWFSLHCYFWSTYIICMEFTMFWLATGVYPILELWKPLGRLELNYLHTLAFILLYRIFLNLFILDV